MNIIFPTSGGAIEKLAYLMIKGILGWGWVRYGLAIIFFTIFIKLIMAPIDFLNKYLSRKNQIQTQALSKEINDLQKIYGNDPLAFTRARQELLRKNGVGGLGSSLMMIVSLILTMAVFFSVFGALREISKVNIYHQYETLSAVYDQYHDADATTLHDQLNQAYDETTHSFLWIKNIWQPDTPWASSVMSFDEFNSTQPKDKKLADTDKDKYVAIYQQIDATKQNTSNGWLLLVLLAGLTSFLSSKVTSLITKRNAPQTKKEKPAEIITYSLRDAKAQNAANASMDPAQASKMLQWIMPLTFVLFALFQNAAFGLYMIASSLVSTLLTLLFSWLVDLVLKNYRPKNGNQTDFDATVINPHTKYFKGGKK